MKQILPKFNKKSILILALIILVVMVVFASFRAEPKSINYKDLNTLLRQNLITKAVMNNDEIVFYTQNERFKMIKDAVDIKELIKSIPIYQEKSYILLDEFLTIIVLMLIFLVGFYLLIRFRSKQLKTDNQNISFELENMINQNLMPVISNVKFCDVAGIDDVKFELSEIVDFLKNPKKYREFGIKMPKGVLMVGPPGVGKTMVAKAVAGEANVPFFYQNGASFVQIYVGIGAKRVRELFAKAKAYAPSIVFIDEIDAVGKSRGGGRNDEREATLNQLLTEMDGFLDNSGVIVMAATNRIEMIDEALLRSGRFDRRIFLSMPSFNDRVAILNSYLKDKQARVDVSELARMSVGFSGAALSTLVNEAAINALRNNTSVISMLDFEAVLSKVIVGKKRALSFSEDEKRLQSLYQAAKALSAYWFDIKFDKISLIDDRFVQNDSEFESKTYMINRIKVLISGVSKLELEYDDIFSNAYHDLNKAKDLAQKMVYEYAMGDSFVPNPADVEKILQLAKNDVSEFLRGVVPQNRQIAEYIYKNESISKAEVARILNKSYE
ncbi:ATP-dependent metallopeptidase FtsH/Yme1/Tma family protein [Campylobacter majalis]|uniref:ATP-dependent metallopeptidase FtsH/Yme1/Tma family protein n=1 Tax=Campylobacter majalis TaxID=2790656 RepID=UPI003D68C4ED